MKAETRAQLWEHIEDYAAVPFHDVLNPQRLSDARKLLNSHLDDYYDDMATVTYETVKCRTCGERYDLPALADGWFLDFDIKHIDDGGHTATATITDLEAARVEARHA